MGVTALCERVGAAEGFSGASVGGGAARGGAASEARAVAANDGRGWEPVATRVNSMLLISGLGGSLLEGAPPGAVREGAALRGAAARGGAAGVAGTGTVRVAANSDSARCSLGVINLGSPRARARESISIMTAPTMVQRPSMVRTITAERESPRSNANTGPAFGSANASIASRTTLCSSGPMEPSLNHSTSPCSSWNEMA